MSDSFFFNATTFLSSLVPSYVSHSLLLVFLLLALWLFFSSRVVLRGERPSEVVSDRAFRYVRHPMYLAAILGYFAAAFYSFSLASLALLVPIYTASYEEKLLEVKFGDKYKAYEQKMGKWLPKIRKTKAENRLV